MEGTEDNPRYTSNEVTQLLSKKSRIWRRFLIEYSCPSGSQEIRAWNILPVRAILDFGDRQCSDLHDVIIKFKDLMKEEHKRNIYVSKIGTYKTVLYGKSSEESANSHIWFNVSALLKGLEEYIRGDRARSDYLITFDCIDDQDGQGRDVKGLVVKLIPIGENTAQLEFVEQYQFNKEFPKRDKSEGPKNGGLFGAFKTFFVNAGVKIAIYRGFDCDNQCFRTSLISLSKDREIKTEDSFFDKGSVLTATLVLFVEAESITEPYRKGPCQKWLVKGWDDSVMLDYVKEHFVYENDTSY